MPTGYTATLMEKGQTFQEFIMGCVRAFEAFIEMRDSPSDAAIPEKFEPSDHYAKRIIEAREKLEKLKEMTDAEKADFGQIEKDMDIKRIKQWLKKATAQNKRLEDMAAQVKAWNPPTDDHQGLKDFMLEQISISKNGLDYIQALLTEATSKPAASYYVAAISEATLSIEYYTEENAKEIRRASDRTKWIQKLRSSI